MLPAHFAERFPPSFHGLTPGRLCDRALSLKLAPRFIPPLSRQRVAAVWSLSSFLPSWARDFVIPKIIT